MSWDYRIVKYRDGSGYGLHEVYYDEAGEPWSMTEKPVGFTCHDYENPQQSIGEQLMTARTHARLRPIFNEPAEWPGKNPVEENAELRKRINESR
jgi:hypothetical protein